MIKIIYVAGPEGGKLTMRAEGHAGYAPAGQDIVCAAVSCLMQTLAYSAAEDEHTSSCIYQGEEGPVLNVEAGDSVLMRDKFELVADGLDLLAEQYPENVNFKKRCKCSPAVDLQLFAEGGGDGAAAAGGDGAAPAAAEKAASAPAKGKGREAAAAEVDEMLSPAEEPGAEEDAAEGEGQDGAADKSSTDPEAHRKAFGELMRGEYNREFGEMIVQATQKAYDSILNEQGPVGRILNALGQKYGTAPGDYEALAAAVEGGVVKDDAYYEDMAMKKGISVQLAKEMDALESENAKHRAAEQQRAEAAKMEAIQQEWDAAAERIRAEDPGFDIKTALADPDFAQMLKLGVKMEDAYKARYFDDIMARRTTQTAKTVEKGVEARIRQRGARPAENGTNPGGAAVLKTDVSKLTPQQCEELERRAMRGQIITF
nr:MAG TPA: YsxB-like protein [Caudoviricetes sp.]